MNRTEKQGGTKPAGWIRLYRSKWLAITLRFLPRHSSTSLFVVSCVRRLPSWLVVDNQEKERERERERETTKQTRRKKKKKERRAGGRKEKRGPAPFFSRPSYCGSLLHAGCPCLAKGLSRRRTEPNARCRPRSPARERNTLSGGVERQKSNRRPFACQLGNGASSYHHNRMTRAERAQKTLSGLFSTSRRVQWAE